MAHLRNTSLVLCVSSALLLFFINQVDSEVKAKDDLARCASIYGGVLSSPNGSCPINYQSTGDGCCAPSPAPSPAPVPVPAPPFPPGFDDRCRVLTGGKCTRMVREGIFLTCPANTSSVDIKPIGEQELLTCCCLNGTNDLTNPNWVKCGNGNAAFYCTPNSVCCSSPLPGNIPTHCCSNIEQCTLEGCCPVERKCGLGCCDLDEMCVRNECVPNPPLYCQNNNNCNSSDSTILEVLPEPTGNQSE